jgi:GNAT superfamily N-acetyltransferase
MIAIHQAISAKQLDDVRDLLRAFIEWHRERHQHEVDLVDSYFDPEEFEDELASLPGEFAPPSGRLLLASEDDKPAGCVALHDLGDGVCEMKRMFVYSEFHGRGIGRLLAKEVIAEAKEAGYSAMRLDTGPRQVEALGLYSKIGFKTIDPYYDPPDRLREWLIFMELDLSA